METKAAVQSMKQNCVTQQLQELGCSRMAMLLTMFAQTHNITVGNSLEYAGQDPRRMLVSKVQKPLKMERMHKINQSSHYHQSVNFNAISL